MGTSPPSGQALEVTENTNLGAPRPPAGCWAMAIADSEIAAIAKVTTRCILVMLILSSGKVLRVPRLSNWTTYDTTSCRDDTRERDVTGPQPPMACIGRGGATNWGLLISCPSHFLPTQPRIAAAISASGAPLRSSSLTSVSSMANRQ